MSTKHYKVEDYMLDEQFKNWVLDPRPESDEYWAKWLESHPNEKSNFLLAKELILQTQFGEHKPSKDASGRVLNSILQNSHTIGEQQKFEKTSNVHWRLGLKIAASIVVILGVYFLVDGYETSQLSEEKATAIVVKQNPAGRKSQIFLPDGSRVWLNSASSLEYGSDFGSTTRHLKLIGEAYFDVEEDKTKPFVVESNGLSVTALGTAFNVSAYENNATTEVSLIEGLVKVETINENVSGHTILNPNEYLNYTRSSKEIEKGKIGNIGSRVSWKEGIIHFEEASLSDVISKLERWYGVDIATENEESENVWKYSSEFDNQSLENVLKSLSYTEDFTYSIDKNKVKIKF